MESGLVTKQSIKIKSGIRVLEYAGVVNTVGENMNNSTYAFIFF